MIQNTMFQKKSKAFFRPASCRWIIFSILIGILLLRFNKVFALSIVSSPVTFPEVTLSGSSQTVDGTSDPWRVDATDESSGWNVTVSSTHFENEGGKQLDVSNLKVRLLDEKITYVSGDTNRPSSVQTTFTSLSDNGLKIASAAEGNGGGIYDLSPDFQLTIPSEAYEGTYTATLTVNISSGP